MSLQFFDRQYRVRIGPAGSAGKEIGKPSEATGRAIRCQFSCEAGDSSSANTGKIILWNLSDETLRLLEQEDCLIELRAGYGSDLPLIMGGNLTYCTTTRSGADQQTEIEFEDGFVAMRDAVLSVGYSGQVNGQKIVADAAAEMGCEVKYSAKAVLRDFVNFAFVGGAKTLIDRICSISKMRWSLQNGIIQICAPNEPLTTAVYLLSPSSGLVGSPKPIYESSATSDPTGGNTTKSRAKKGVEVQYLLNGHIQVDDLVKVESERFSGQYRVGQIVFSGDSEGSEWICTAQLLEVS